MSAPSMESHTQRSHGKHYEEEDPGLHPAMEGEDNHHEKKSVLKKVKAKAKKIKETLTKHAHGHDHDNHHGDEEDEDEEMVEDPEVHGAPISESAAVRSVVPGTEVNMGQARGNLEKPSVMAEDRYDFKLTDPPVRPFDQWREENSEQTRATLGRPTAMEEARSHVPEDKHVSLSSETYGPKPSDPTANNVGRQEEKLGESRVKMGVVMAMEEDPHGPKDRPEAFYSANYQAKATDPSCTGAQEAGITPILRSFDKMGVYDEPAPNSKLGPDHSLNTGSHGQFSPDPLPSNTASIPENPNSVPKNLDTNTPEELPPDTLAGNPSTQSSYTEIISSATSAIANKAVSAKNAVASKLGYGGNGDTEPQETHGGGDSDKSSSTTEYVHKIAATVTEQLAPVYEKVAEAGSAVISKVQGTGTGEEDGGQGVSVKDYLMEKFKPSEEDKALSEVISDALQKKEKAEKTREAEQSGGRPILEVVPDSLHKRNEKQENERENEGETRPMGKVTESEEVGWEAMWVLGRVWLIGLEVPLVRGLGKAVSHRVLRGQMALHTLVVMERRVLLAEKVRVVRTLPESQGVRIRATDSKSF